MAAIVALLAAGCSSTSSSTETTLEREPIPIVVNSQLPGWVPVPFGSVQIDVPGSWSISEGGGYTCGPAEGSVYLGQASAIAGMKHCPAENEVSFEHMSKTEFLPLTKARWINGIAVQAFAANKPDDVTIYAPSHGIELHARGPEAQHVVRSLTHSPLAVVTAPGPPTTAPAGWRTLTFGGITMKVPPSWSTQSTENVGFCEVQVQPATVVLSTAETRISPSCPAPLGRASDQAAQQGLDLFSGRHSTVASVGPLIKQRLMVNGLSVGISRASETGGVMVADVAVPGLAQRLVLWLGLAGDGLVPREILDSVRPS